MIYIATHKPFQPPHLTGLAPLQAGAALHPDLGYLRDDTHPDNISARNPNYCELTALHWVWRASKEPHKGLCHYRRYFASNRFQHSASLDEPALIDALRRHDIIVPSEARMLQSLASELVHSQCCQPAALHTLRDAIAHHDPAALTAYDQRMSGCHSPLYNMLFATASVVDDYCAWLFPILDEVHERTDYSPLNAFQRRLPGFLAERLLGVYIDAKNLRIRHIPVCNTEATFLETLAEERRNITNPIRFHLRKWFRK